MNIKPVLALGRSELRLLRRNHVVATLAIALPLVLGVLIATRAKEFGNAFGWGTIVSSLLVFILVMSNYVTTTTAVVARREDLFLKRLRSGESSDATVMLGLVGPPALLAVIQAVLLLAVMAVVGGNSPENPALVVLAIVVGSAMFTALAMLTTVVTPNADSAQITTMPFFMAAFAAVFMSGQGGEQLHRWSLLIPGGGIADVTSVGWSGNRWDGAPLGFGEQFVSALPPLAVTLAWIVLAGLAARRWFRWEPRR
ncbi:membrane protein [Longimycelium tulufanense]|uniref:Membrane protein n=1 Tax=Longimycelium tulufanense TaxID=907463 RepID=A0A8J3CH92_9PSEU|nr:ABC transporter permease [Longimycelium tulufanense]GGM69255.1 membrane protein [Longimycelium tulufanense]